MKVDTLGVLITALRKAREDVERRMAGESELAKSDRQSEQGRAWFAKAFQESQDTLAELDGLIGEFSGRYWEVVSAGKRREGKG